MDCYESTLLSLYRPNVHTLMLACRLSCFLGPTVGAGHRLRYSGVYLTYPCQLSTPSPLATDMGVAQRWWTLVNDRIDDCIAATTL